MKFQYYVLQIYQIMNLYERKLWTEMYLYTV
jgi:hypothetical protein